MLTLNPRKSLRVENLFYLLLGSILPAVIILVIFSTHLIGNLHKELINNVEKMAKVAEADVSNLLNRFKINIIKQAHADFVAELIEAGEEAADSLPRLIKHLKVAAHVETAAIYDPYGHRLTTTDKFHTVKKLNIKLLDSIEAKKEENEPALLIFSIGKYGGVRVDAYAPIVEPFYKYLIGILHETIYIGGGFLSELKEKTGLETALFHREKALIYTLPSVPVLDIQIYLQFLLSKIMTTQDSLIVDDVVYHTVLFPLLRENGSVFGGIGLLGSENVIEQSRFFIEKIFLIALVGIILFAFGISHFSKKRVIKPILDVVNSLKKTAKGDLTQRIEVKSKNEIGELAHSFNKMSGDLQNSREALITMKDYTNNIVESMVDTLIVFDLVGKIKTANRALLNLLGYEKKEIIGKPMQTIMNDKVFMKINVQEPLEEDSIVNYELTYKSKNGKSIPMLFSGSAMRDKTGKIEGIVGIAKDITELKQTEEQLRKLYTAVEQSPSLVLITDTKGKIEYANPKFCKTTGYALEEAVGQNTRILKYSMTPPKIYKEMWDTILSGVEWRGEIQNKKKNGKTYWESLAISPIKNPDGVTTHFLSVGEDITQHKKAEEALLESEERFRQIFEQNEEAIMIFKSGSNEILDANPAAVHLYGFARQELIGTGLSSFVDRENQELFKRTLSNIDYEKGFSLGQQTHIRKDGTEIIVNVRGKLILLQQSQVSYCTFQNITEELRREEEAKLMQARLIQTDKMASLGTMVSGVAHEINNPNNFVMFNAPVIAEVWRDAFPILKEYRRENGEFSLAGLPFTELQEVFPKLITGILEGSQRIKNIVDNLRDFSKKDKSGLHTDVNINKVIRSAAALLDNQIKDSTDYFRLDCEDPLPMVKGSAQQLEQVIVNLIINSLQALPDKKRGVWLSSMRDKETGSVVVKIRDEGHGMAREVLEKIMEPFYTTKQNTGGTGLGLFISYSIIKEHKGALDFQSEVNKGTLVSIKLPAVA